MLKQIRGTDLIGAIAHGGAEAVAARPGGGQPASCGRMRDQAGRADPLSGADHTQERRILELIGKGLTNRQIGERLFLAEKTVKNYVSSLFAKLGMERRTQAAAYAARVFDGRAPDR